MSDRPTSVTIVAWLLLIGGMVDMGLAVALASLDNAGAARMAAHGIHVIPMGALFVFDGVIRLFCGYGLLRGASVARVLFLAWGPVAMLWIALGIGSVGMTIKYAAFYGLFSRVMFRRPANLWFEAAYA